jgi:hypothetical protein
MTVNEIALTTGNVVERVTADELAPGDTFAAARTHQALVLAEVESVGESSRYLRLADGGRLRPRHTTKFWRVTR